MILQTIKLIHDKNFDNACKVIHRTLEYVSNKVIDSLPDVVPTWTSPIGRGRYKGGTGRFLYKLRNYHVLRRTEGRNRKGWKKAARKWARKREESGVKFDEDEFCKDINQIRSEWNNMLNKKDAYIKDEEETSKTKLEDPPNIKLIGTFMREVSAEIISFYIATLACNFA